MDDETDDPPNYMKAAYVWALADYLGCKKLQNAIIDRILEKLPKSPNGVDIDILH